MHFRAKFVQDVICWINNSFNPFLSYRIELKYDVFTSVFFIFYVLLICEERRLPGLENPPGDNHRNGNLSSGEKIKGLWCAGARIGCPRRYDLPTSTLPVAFFFLLLQILLVPLVARTLENAVVNELNWCLCISSDDVWLLVCPYYPFFSGRVAIDHSCSIVDLSAVGAILVALDQSRIHESIALRLRLVALDVRSKVWIWLVIKYTSSKFSDCFHTTLISFLSIIMLLSRPSGRNQTRMPFSFFCFCLIFPMPQGKSDWL